MSSAQQAMRACCGAWAAWPRRPHMWQELYFDAISSLFTAYRSATDSQQVGCNYPIFHPFVLLVLPCVEKELLKLWCLIARWANFFTKDCGSSAWPVARHVAELACLSDSLFLFPKMAFRKAVFSSEHIDLFSRRGLFAVRPRSLKQLGVVVKRRKVSMLVYGFVNSLRLYFRAARYADHNDFGLKADRYPDCTCAHTQFYRHHSLYNTVIRIHRRLLQCFCRIWFSILCSRALMCTM